MKGSMSKVTRGQGQRSGQTYSQQSDTQHSCFQILEAVTRLATIYIKMCAAGSVLFQDWKVDLNCSETAKFHTIVDFGVAESKLPSNKGSVVAQTHSLADFMQVCHSDWQRHLEEKRFVTYKCQRLILLFLVIQLLQNISKVH